MEEHSIAIQRMRNQFEKWQQASDPRATFLYCYLMMTENMLAAIQAGEFHDRRWVYDLLEHFAGYYFSALQSYEQQDPQTPAIWRLTFDSVKQTDLMALQNLLLGINAHINYDLVLVLCDLLEKEWGTLDEDQRRQRYEDHCHVNRVIARTMDIVQDEVIERNNPMMEFIDRVFGQLDEWMISQLIESWREHVWQIALTRIQLNDQNERENQRQAVESDCLARARRVLLI